MTKLKLNNPTKPQFIAPIEDNKCTVVISGVLEVFINIFKLLLVKCKRPCCVAHTSVIPQLDSGVQLKY
ncbi:hypothetical protein FLA4_06250 [Candidatus Rickettsia kotlanii]|nr:hypothetical protein FLA4_06250 [Candidatus Rickettsia kotlanii]BDU61458.1 hypothetical protein HM2_06260 [Candidatus Rickettsia kotlanii]